MQFRGSCSRFSTSSTSKLVKNTPPRSIEMWGIPDSKISRGENEGEIKDSVTKEVNADEWEIINSVDPFNIYDILDKKKQLNHKISIQSEGDPKFPPGFTPHNSDSEFNSTVSDYFIAIMGKWLPNDRNYLIILIYAPQDLSEKKMLWQYLAHIIGGWNGDVIIMGDFNEVRFEAERFGFIFNAHGAAIFNSFIFSSGLVEVPSGGYSFTWAHKSTTKISKLDHFLISKALMRNCPNISFITLDRFLSDHRPILLHEICLDYGPTPFWLFHLWFGFIGFDSFVFESWKDIQIQDQNAMLNFSKKLKILKGRIRSWVKDEKEKAHVLKNSLKKKLPILIPSLTKAEGNF
ncbi:RNA-directed DNA polymerase, eukaryota [Tanacetum coccineum]